MKYWKAIVGGGLTLFLLLGAMPSWSVDFDSKSSDTIVFPYERKTFIEGEKSVSFRLRNATKHTPFLMQASVEKLDETTGVNTLEKEGSFPFMVTPPLHKLEPGQRYHWRVLFIGDAKTMPSDRETVYIAKFRVIPPSTPVTADDKNDPEFDAIQVLHFKLYYRPKSIEKYSFDDAAKKLVFKTVGNELVVMNNSPIYLAFDRVNVGGVELESNELFKPLKPFSEQRFKINGKIKGDKVKWAILNDLVLPMEEQESTLQ